jgi:hypothetical protein
MDSTQLYWLKISLNTWSILVRKLNLVELLLVLGRFILLFQLRVISLSKMFPTTSSKDAEELLL